ncbi:MAG: molecular chaperone HtpG [Clostridiales bacterium]|nr:molecular chaperone HtpG [Clostridiales bacterium]
MEKKEFKTESKRILDMMINSVYTHREIFLREIISNASDALDKLAYRALTDDSVGLSGDDFRIKITLDKDARTVTVSDNGIGMTAEELENNLGVIAQSGSFRFKNGLDSDKVPDVDIIGQFGVGFYSAFMVSSKVSVVTKAFGSDQAFCWESDGSDGYTVSESTRSGFGTDVIMHLKDDSEEENYSEFLDFYRIRELIKKYSDYIRFPIVMDVPKSRAVESDETDEDGKKKTTYESYTEEETVNSRIPIWKRSREEVPDEDCVKFYKEKYYEHEDPVALIRADVQGLVSYKALLFIPASAPFGYYSRDFEKGLSLYSNGVMIIDKCADLLPDHFRFVKGIVDSDDLSLNISRELLQHDRQLKVIASSLEKRIKRELKNLLENDREKYEKFFTAFGLQLKYGVVNDYGAHKELLSDLLLFRSMNKKAPVTLAEYVAAMPEDQKHIYYACGESAEKIEALPQSERIRDKGFDLLCLTDDVDQFVMEMLGKFEEKDFKSADADDDELVGSDEKEKAEEAEKTSADLLAFVKETLGDSVSAVRISRKLKSHPVCLSSEGGITIEMEKYFATLPGDNKPKADRVLELNAGHEAFAALSAAFENDRDTAAKYARILYSQALLIAGLPLENPTEYSDLVCGLMK